MSTRAQAVRVRWSELPTDRPMALIERQRVIGEHVMISRVVLRRGFSVSTHHHANEQMSAVLSGRLRFGVGAEDTAQRREIDVSEGEVIHLPPGTPHSATALEDSVVLDIFSPPSEKTGIDRA